MTTARNAIVSAAGLAALAVGLAGCTSTHQFSGQLRYGNLMGEEMAETSTENAKAQVSELAASYGLEVHRSSEDRMHFTAQAPSYTVTQPDGGVEERADPRVVHVEVIFDDAVGGHAYRYFCWVTGNEPAHFDDEDRARFGLALLAVREIFEKPIETDFLGG